MLSWRVDSYTDSRLRQVRRRVVQEIVTEHVDDDDKTADSHFLM